MIYVTIYIHVRYTYAYFVNLLISCDLITLNLLSLTFYPTVRMVYNNIKYS